MARRGEQFARLNAGGGYSQALTVGKGKGFSGTEREIAKQGRGKRSSTSGSGCNGGGGSCSSSTSVGTMNAYARHQELIRNYQRYHLNAKVPSSGAVEARGLAGQKRLTDDDALRRQHRFVRDDEEDSRAYQARGLEGAEADPSAWEVRMAAKYYKLLFKEYALADLSRYREDKVGLRWRTEKDVVSGKGQFACGSLTCQERRDLHSYELNFKYKEAGITKNELVKVRVCPQCARKLFRKKIEALRRQREVEALAEEQQEDRVAQESVHRDRRRKMNPSRNPVQPSSPHHGHDHVGADPAVLGRSTLLLSSDDGVVGNKGYPRREEGHDLVREAVAASTKSTAPARRGGLVSSPEGLARRSSSGTSWGNETAPSSAVVAGAEAARSWQRDGSQGGGHELSAAAAAAGGRGISSEESRKAWAGELERDRTAEDEMDDYLLSLLL